MLYLVRLTIRLRMPAQTKISSFFSTPTSRSRSRSKPVKKLSQSQEEVENVSPKKAKIEMEEDAQGKNEQMKETESPLSVEENKRLENHRLAAKLKLLNSKSQGVVTDVGLSWYRALENEFTKDYFKNLCCFVSAERQRCTVYPPPNQVFTWTKACEITNVKVVILGQDPYHGPKQAHGLSFSVLPGVRAPPSLANMYKELSSDVEGFTKPSHGYLAGWATQGVLLLNACLTVKASQANSHAGKGWENFTDAVIQWLNAHSSGIVFMLWGSYAQKKGACIDQKRHHVLKSVHPSPLSAHRGFLGCKHFSKCNELLKASSKKAIDWSYLPEH